LQVVDTDGRPADEIPAVALVDDTGGRQADNIPAEHHPICGWHLPASTPSVIQQRVATTSATPSALRMAATDGYDRMASFPLQNKQRTPIKNIFRRSDKPG